jgi:hypothetical protein
MAARIAGSLGRIAPCDYRQLCLLRLHDICCATAYDRLQGDPFIQLFLFQRAMMNGEAVQLAI